ncbi:MAG: DNA/RNA non-specific endonuclease, partial [Lentisphaeria bacterium]|nr:DNA/RNA non-specific endonuclease [Lentisphaeria bacterium]
EREGYALGYIEKHEQPAWVQYIMTSEEVSRRAAKRGDDFRPDPAVPTGSATPQDYTRSGYDRGHLAPAADMSFSAKAMSESFFMSNMSPQAPQFNRGIWSKLEKQVRYFATKEKRIVVVTGPILPAEKTITIGANRVTVPQYYYKVIYDTTPPEKMIGFVLPNKGSSADLRTFVVTVDQVEELTGLDFFSAVPKEKQEQLERTITVENWHWIR